MYERDRDVTKDGAEEHWLGVQEAATYLGIHRATLFRAMSSGMIVADYKTPMGRARFRQQTVDAFKEKLKAEAATSHKHVDAPLRVLAKLANLSSGSSPSTNPVATIVEVTQSLCAPVGAFDVAAVAVRVPDENDPFALRILAAQGLTERFKAAYQCLRPCEDFPITDAMRTGEPVICDDLHAHPFRQATVSRVMIQNSVISYAVFPIATGGGAAREVIGALVVCGHTPHKFSQREELFLGGVADALSACITNSALRDNIIQTNTVHLMTPDLALNTASLLLETAFEQARRRDTAPSGVDAIVSLCNMFSERSYALATWVEGFPPRARGGTSGGEEEDDALLRHYLSNLQSLVWQTRGANGLRREQWQSRVTAVALSLALPAGDRVAVGAVWPGVRAEVKAEEILLSTLASACSLVSQLG
jgi:excisionase family DNA binding protein